MSSFFKKHAQHIGMALVYTGAVLLIVNFLAGWSHINALQFLALLLIIAGIIVHVSVIKKSGNY
ncbi:MAG: hypothetical protein PUH24_10095 [Prevotellaceae bacterium]|nr:hypothetical protein [Prevotella sp.]MDD7258597.1 hypothetical protein [Prevotellaceae bacterium]MDY6130005.1 hypothetical protein [Prevotella sp.]